MTESAPTAPGTPPDAPRPRRPAPAATVAARRRRAAVVLAVLALVVVGIVVAVSGGSPQPAAPAATAAVVPGDALVYLDLSLRRGHPEVAQALAVARRFPDFPVAYAGAVTKLGAIISGGHAVDFGAQISPWLGGDAALALLNSSTSTAGSLVVLSVTDPAKARSFVRSAGATSHGSYRGRALLVYSNGNELAFL